MYQSVNLSLKNSCSNADCVFGHPLTVSVLYTLILPFYFDIYICKYLTIFFSNHNPRTYVNNQLMRGLKLVA